MADNPNNQPKHECKCEGGKEIKALKKQIVELNKKVETIEKQLVTLRKVLTK